MGKWPFRGHFDIFICVCSKVKNFVFMSKDYPWDTLKLWQNLIRRSQACLGLNTFSFEAVLHPEWILANFPLYLRAWVLITKYYIKGNGRLGWLHQLTPDTPPHTRYTNPHKIHHNKPDTQKFLDDSPPQRNSVQSKVLSTFYQLYYVVEVQSIIINYLRLSHHY